MALTNLSQVIKQIQSQDHWQKQRQFTQVLEHWSVVVGESVAKQTIPMKVYRDILQVAVPSSVWSQALTFERRLILSKLNPLLGNTPLQDIHFSTAQWASVTSSTSHSKEQRSPSSVSDAIKLHPSYIPPAASAEPQISKSIMPPPQDALEAFQRWAKLVKSNNAQLPNCPRCQRSSPSGEIARWQMCRNCANKHFFHN